MRPLSFQNLTHKLYIASLGGIAITMPLALRLNSIMVIVTGISAFLYFLSHKHKLVFNKLTLLFIGLYLGAVVGVINSVNLKIALFDLEQKLPWLIFPLIFLLGSKITKGEFAFILRLFLLSICGVNTYALLTPESFINQPLEIQLSMTWFSWNESLPIDRIYLGMYSVFGLVIVNYLFGLSSRIIEKIIYSIVFLFLIVSLINTFAKIAMTIFVVICILELGYILYIKGKAFFYTGLGIFTTITIIVLVTNNPLHNVAKKVLNREKFDFPDKPLLFESINFRYLTWESSWIALKQDNNWLTGVGTGDTQKTLNEIYQLKLNEHERNHIAMGYNSHNQYFTTWLNLGLIFFLILVYQFFYSLHIYYRAGLRIGIYFILIVMISCVTESMLERQQGIVFYTFFQLLFFSRINQEDDSIAGNLIP